ncbi:MAG: hypothetical protein KA073_00055 [Aliarcobacter sp.]|nr:hypothetical protein [Aliarcobacter sp.]
MLITSENTNELVEIALKTSSLKDILILCKCPSMIVRRALAKNTNISQEIINYLINDPVLNVSYTAYKNPNNKNKEKVFYEENLRPCIICEDDNKFLSCEKCERINDHHF